MYSGLPKIAPVCVCHYTVIPFSGVLMVTNRTLYKYISISAQAKLSGDARDQFRPGFRILLVGLGAGVALNYLEVIFFNCNLIFLSCWYERYFLAVKLYKVFIIYSMICYPSLLKNCKYYLNTWYDLESDNMGSILVLIINHPMTVDGPLTFFKKLYFLGYCEN